MAELTLGQAGSRFVFIFTALASLLTCSSYLAFIGSTLSTMSTQEGNVLQELFPEVSKQAFQEATAAVLLPITLLRDFGFLSFTS
ncbi:MAG: hypothetical protein ACK55Z_32990, partial [bacterium]